MEAPRKTQRPLESAFVAIFLGLLIPGVVFLFGAVRARQLQSKANPRWADFAKFTGSIRETPAPTTAPLRLASLPDELRRDTSSSVPLPDTADLTGSISGRSSVDRSIGKESTARFPHHADTESMREQLPDVVHQPILFRPVEEQAFAELQEAQSLQTALRAETRTIEMRHRLEQLNVQQEQFHGDSLQRDAQIRDMLQRLETTLQAIAQRQQPQLAGLPRQALNPNDKSSEGDDRHSSISSQFSTTELVDEAPTGIAPIEQPVAEDAESNPETASLTSQSAAAAPSASAGTSPASIQVERLPGDGAPPTYRVEAHDADVRQLLLKLAVANSTNLLLSPEVTGSVTVKLDAMSFDEALTAILHSRNLVSEHAEGILVVSTLDEAVRLRQQRRPLKVHIYQPSYLSAVELERLIAPMLSPDGRHSESAVATDAETSTSKPNYQRETVVVQDLDEVLARIDQMVIDLDVPPLQVEFEAQILSVRLTGAQADGLDLQSLPCVPAETDNDTLGLKRAYLANNVPTFIKSVASLANTTLVSSQRVRVLNKQRAELIFGDRLGLQSKAGQAVQLAEAGTRITVQSTIAADGWIRLEIHPQRTLKIPQEGTSTTHESRVEFSTQALVPQGSTVAIGGLIAEPLTDPAKPEAGANSPRTELLILLTPRILAEQELKVNARRAPKEAAAGSGQVPNHFQQQRLSAAHCERAASYLEQRDTVKARQQINAALRLDAQNAEAQKLSQQIDDRLNSTRR